MWLIKKWLFKFLKNILMIKDLIKNNKLKIYKNSYPTLTLKN